MYHAHNTFQFEIPCSQLLVELYQPIQCILKNSKPFNSISEKMIIISIIFIKFHMIHIIFALKHHNTDTQQKEQYICHAPLSTNIFF